MLVHLRPYILFFSANAFAAIRTSPYSLGLRLENVFL